MFEESKFEYQVIAKYIHQSNVFLSLKKSKFK